MQPVRATIAEAPRDLQLLALRHRDGTISLALWRTAKVWSAEQNRDLDVPSEHVRVTLPAQASGALATDLVTGNRQRLAAGDAVELDLGGAPVVVTGLQPTS